jgi:hypothetical protein
VFRVKGPHAVALLDAWLSWPRPVGDSAASPAHGLDLG